MIRHGYADVNEIQWHYAATGEEGRPLIIFAHGFPEFWYEWHKQLKLLGDQFHCVAPDLTGYNLSSKPSIVERYRTKRLVGDLESFAGLFAARRFTLVAHDWGGALAWAFALKCPELLERLVIINAVHPGAFQREIARNPAQAGASQYILSLRAADAESRYSADNYALVWRSLSRAHAAGHLSDEDKQAYLKAYAQPGALTGMLNWYRAMRMSPPSGDKPADAGMYDDASLIVRVPTLVLWGMKDESLLLGCIEDLDRFVPGVIVKRFDDGSHWLVHEKPAEVAREIREFCGG
jgi:pimeloyl-ACP methyl ester carboxylesterase